MPRRPVVRSITLSVLLIFSFILTNFITSKPVHAAGLAFSGGTIDFSPGQSKSFTVSWSSDVGMLGVEATLTSAAGDFSIDVDTYSSLVGGIANNWETFSEAVSGASSGNMFVVTVTAPSSSSSGTLNISGFGEDINQNQLSASSSYTLKVQAPTPTTAAPTPTPTTATTTAVPTTTTTPAATTTKATTAATTAATTTATQTTTEETTTAETTTEETTTEETTTAEATTTTAQHFTLTGNGVQDTFALMPANDVSAPLGFSKTSGSFQGVDATLFTRAGSLPLVYGALSNDATPLFYVYDATNSALYNFFNDIILQADNKSWTVSPMAVPAPGPEFRYRSISINGQPMSVYEAQIGGSKQTLIYAAEYGQTDKSLYLYNASNPSGALVKYDPAIKPSSSPSSTTAAGLISITTTQPPSSANKGGIDFLTILLIIVFVALASGLAYVAYLNKARIMAIFTNEPLNSNEAYLDDEDYFDGDDELDNGPPQNTRPPIKRV